MGAYLNIDHMDKTFARGSKATEVLKDVTLRVEKGEFVSIIGHSGCGKSTLLNIVAGLTTPTRGGVILDGKEVNTPGPARAVVFQNHSLLPWLTVHENVKLAVDKVFGSSKSRAERREWVLHNLALVQMTQAKDKRPAEISGGMKQRAAHRAGAVDAAEGFAAGRAVRRARCADPRASARPGDGHPRQPR